MAIKDTIQTDMKTALRAGEKERLGVIRMLVAAIKQREIDERTDLDDPRVLQVVEKLIKQRRDAAVQFADAGRADLEQKELAEIEVLQAYLPEPLGDAELEDLIDAVITATGATSMRDMGQVMNAVRERAQGRVDMAVVSQRVKARLS